MEEEKFVYHGSPRLFDGEQVVPKRSRRFNTENVLIFDDVSFHATPHRWIAVAYTYNGRQTFELEGKKYYYNMGVSLYEDNKEVEIFGVGSLEESLDKLYGQGGYVYHFDKEHFFYTEGLGPREVITKSNITPANIEHIADPVAELQKAGVTFRFIDLANPGKERAREMMLVRDSNEKA